MAYKTFAAIDVGSNDVSMKIYEVTTKKGFREVDYASRIIELGSDTYKSGYVSNERIDELCEVLGLFQEKMKEYACEEYRAYATSAIREAENSEILIDQIKLRTGFKVKILSNSEHRFIMYKGCASRMDEFDRITSKNTVMIDIGAGSVQLSLFEKQRLTATQNIKIGSVRVRDMMSDIELRTTKVDTVMEEYVENEIVTFHTMYLGDKDIKNVIAIGDEIKLFSKIVPELAIENIITKEQVEKIYDKIKNTSAQDLSIRYGIPFERATLLMPSIAIFRIFLNTSKAEVVCTPDVSLCDGIVVDYMDQENKLAINRSFEEDIIASAKNMAKRYRCNKAHIQNVSRIALDIFDSIKKIYGMGGKERLQLEIAAIVHDCGKYINMQNVAINSYNIIMSTEMMGLSHKEREEVANIVKYNTMFLPSFSKTETQLGAASYITVAKLAAILRVANAMDRSHKQKIEKFTVNFKDKKLLITADTVSDITLESGLFQSKADFFERVYGIRPVLKQRRSI